MKLAITLLYMPFFFCVAKGQSWLNLTLTECFFNVIFPCANYTHEIILYKNKSQTVFNLDATGANETYKHSLFDRNSIITIFIHGYVSSPDSESSVQMREAYSSLETTTNFFIVNVTKDFGGKFLDITNYMRASHVTKCVGQIIGKYLAALHGLGVNEDNIHLIGHSLGAQAVHSSAEEFTELTKVKIKRATGLDPAGPCFDPSTTQQLNSNDAKLVDIIHTNAGVSGTITRLGHANFIPNGGSLQEGCGLNLSCSHNRPSHYYRESVTSSECIYTSVKSHIYFLLRYFLKSNNESKIEQMGYRWSGSAGLYDAATSSQYPFCMGVKGINL